RFFDGHNAAIGGRQHIQAPFRRHAGRVAEKLQHEQGNKPERQRCPARKETDDEREQHTAGQERPAFASDERMGIRWFIHGRRKNNRNWPCRALPGSTIERSAGSNSRGRGSPPSSSTPPSRRRPSPRRRSRP